MKSALQNLAVAALLITLFSACGGKVTSADTGARPPGPPANKPSGSTNKSIHCVSEDANPPQSANPAQIDLTMTAAPGDSSVLVTMTQYFGSPVVRPSSEVAGGFADDFVTGSTCTPEGIKRMFLPNVMQTPSTVSQAILFRVCSLSSVSLYISKENGDLATLVRNKKALQLGCTAVVPTPTPTLKP